MKERLRRILTILCVLALVCGLAATALAAEDTIASAAITVAWNDENDLDGLRPDSLEATLYVEGLAFKTVTLNPGNGWSALVDGIKADAEIQWDIAAVNGYARTQNTSGALSFFTLFRKIERTSVSVTQQWSDGNNAHGVRPDSTYVRLLADGQPYLSSAPLNAGNSWSTTWKDLPKYQPGTNTEIVYTVEPIDAPRYYTYEVTGSASTGYVITDTLGTGKLTLRVDFTGIPVNTSLQSLNFVVNGPDYRMPMTITYAQFQNGAYEIDGLLPGAYLVKETNADSLVADRFLYMTSSTITGAAQVNAGGSESIALHNVYRENFSLEVTPRETAVTSEELNRLEFEILGPDEIMPLTIYYSQFTNGRYELDGLTPGTYVILERNAGVLIDQYELTSTSETGVAITVSSNGEARAQLINAYRYTLNTPTPSPTPSVTPSATPGEETPTPSPEPELIDIPVLKIWVDSNNKDGNRPGSITVHLYGDGAEVSSAVLSAGSNWQYIFSGVPKMNGEHEIEYTISEDPVPWYQTQISGFNIMNVYQPETMSVSVQKIWDDNNNLLGLRPASIHVTLSNGMSVVLSQANGWSATISNLPTRLNGQPAVYTWHEQEVLGYVQTGHAVYGNMTIFTNSMFRRPELPEDKKVPKKRGESYFLIDDYDTPLGVEVLINHVGDCFD